MKRPLSKKTVLNGPDMVLYLRTWRLWRAMHWYMQDLGKKFSDMHEDPDMDISEAAVLYSRIARWAKQLDKLWAEKVKIADRLTKAGVQSLPS